MGVKTEIDFNKKRILISHTGKDIEIADVIYDLLIYCGAQVEDIIYTSSDNYKSRIPIVADNAVGIYDYLFHFFVKSASSLRPTVIFIASDNFEQSWGASVEAGASWVTSTKHVIITVNNYSPKEPLNRQKVYIPFKAKETDDGKNKFDSLDSINADNLAHMITKLIESIYGKGNSLSVDQCLAYMKNKYKVNPRC